MGPGSTALTVTPLPATASATPREIAMRAPVAASPRAIARPIPAADPLTMASFPFSSMFTRVSFGCPGTSGPSADEGVDDRQGQTRDKGGYSSELS